MGAATPTRLIDNERVRVTEWRFRPGEATGWHRHEFDYVVVPVTTGQLHLKEPDGERTIDIVLGTPYFRGEGVEHDVINPSETDDVIFIEVEMK
ncbi:MAG: cupin domain-containing protein [Rhodospirillales bacterium]|nr:cupin domain-containing protein [Rhodospirillales bacterium]